MFTIAYTFQDFLGTELGSWLVTTGSILFTAFISVLVSKLRAKASQLLAKDEQLAEQSALILELANRIELLGQLVGLVFVESVSLKPNTKIEVANLAKQIIKDSNSTAGKAIDFALTKGKDALTKETQELLDKAESKAVTLLNKMTVETEPLNVDAAL